MRKRKRAYLALTERMSVPAPMLGTSARVSTYFSSLTEVVERHIRECAGPIQGCIAWLTEPSLVRALSENTYGSTIIVTNDARRRLTSSCGKLKVLRVGTASGRFRPLMHHKFVVLCDAQGAPASVLTGSFNFTAHSALNCETLMHIESREMARHFSSCFASVLRIAR